MLIIPVAGLAIALILAYGASIALYVRERKAQDLLASRDGCRVSVPAEVGVVLGHTPLMSEHEMDVDLDHWLGL